MIVVRRETEPCGTSALDPSISPRMGVGTLPSKLLDHQMCLSRAVCSRWKCFQARELLFLPLQASNLCKLGLFSAWWGISCNLGKSHLTLEPVLGAQDLFDWEPSLGSAFAEWNKPNKCWLSLFLATLVTNSGALSTARIQKFKGCFTLNSFILWKCILVPLLESQTSLLGHKSSKPPSPLCNDAFNETLQLTSGFYYCGCVTENKGLLV